VVPGRFDGEEVGKKQLAAVVIDGSDEGPLLLGIGRPQMERGIMLDQGTDGGGQDFAVVDFPLGPGSVTVQGLGPRRDCRRGGTEPFLLEAIAQGGIVVARDGQARILNQLLLAQQLPPDLGLGRLRELARAPAVIGDLEALRIPPVLLQERKEPGLADLQRTLDLCPAHVSPQIRLQKEPDLYTRESPARPGGWARVNLAHRSLPAVSGKGTRGCSLFSFERFTFQL